MLLPSEIVLRPRFKSSLIVVTKVPYMLLKEQKQPQKTLLLHEWTITYF